MCLEETLRNHGCRVTIVESYSGEISEAFQDTAGTYFELLICTNTSLPLAHIQNLISDIRLLHQNARILVLSGYYPEDFVAGLRETGIDGFLPLPYEEETLITEIARLLSAPT